MVAPLVCVVVLKELSVTVSLLTKGSLYLQTLGSMAVDPNSAAVTLVGGETAVSLSSVSLVSLYRFFEQLL